MSEAESQRDVLIYVPAYNCEKTIVSVLHQIPEDVAARARVLVVDNQSSDRTAARALGASKGGLVPAPMRLLRTRSNLGYAGSQKLCYRLARDDPSLKWVMMLHGDGQYPSELLSSFLPAMSPELALAYGYRSKLRHLRIEQTPWTTWLVISGLSLVESAMTRTFRREWHTGFVMYSTRFLDRIDLSQLTDSPHIDGQLLFLSGAMNEKVSAVPIYKFYKQLTAFEGAARRAYVLEVFRLMRQFAAQKGSIKNRDPSVDEHPVDELYDEIMTIETGPFEGSTPTS